MSAPTVTDERDEVNILPAAPAPASNVEDANSKEQEKHLDVVDPDELHGINKDGQVVDAKTSVGLAVIEQRRAIPMAGKRIVASKWEYWTFVLFFFNSNGSRRSLHSIMPRANHGVAIGGPGGNLRQAMISLSFPEGWMHWGGSYQPGEPRPTGPS